MFEPRQSDFRWGGQEFASRTSPFLGGHAPNQETKQTLSSVCTPDQSHLNVRKVTFPAALVRKTPGGGGSASLRLGAFSPDLLLKETSTIVRKQGFLRNHKTILNLEVCHHHQNSILVFKHDGFNNGCTPGCRPRGNPVSHSRFPLVSDLWFPLVPTRGFLWFPTRGFLWFPTRGFLWFPTRVNCSVSDFMVSDSSPRFPTRAFSGWQTAATRFAARTC